MILKIPPGEISGRYVYERGCGEVLWRTFPDAMNRKRILLALLALALIASGAANGGMRDVWVKAVNICTECIGLG